ncbi:MAG: anti-sigma-factor antagonist [Jatrophihabitantaceae bacterium]|nr:anti-sigma-factor antagonist [Jatrophihabitantaceae bacterium]
MTDLNEAPGTAIRLAGEIDNANASTIVDQVSAALALRPLWVTLDMSAVEFISSTGLGAMVAARHLCIAAGADLTVANPSRAVLRILGVTGMGHLFGAGADE